MGERSAIEWTNSTWNPVTGCTKVSTGCDHCYAETLANGRLRSVYGSRLPIIDTPENQVNPFSVRLWPERLEEPRKWRDPKRIFVNSMSDLFHADIPEDYVRRIFQVMLETPHHIYQVLTKRPSRALRFWKRNQDLFSGGPIPKHIWMGTSVENQEVIHRIAQLRQVPSEIRFLSCEPLLGPVRTNLHGIHWVIVGGESGAGHRAMDLEWAREIRDLCCQSGTAFFFKQVGGRTPKAGGRLLDGRTWDEYPEMEESKVPIAANQ